MQIDLTKFSQTKKVVLPIVEKWGKVNGRTIKINVEDGWYEIELGNDVKVIKKASQLQIEKAVKNFKKYIGFCIGNRFIAATFDTFKRKGFSETIQTLLGSSPLFIPCSILEWEDGRYYFYREEPRMFRAAMESLKRCFDQKIGIKDLKGITPEQRYLFIISRLYQNSYIAYRELEAMAVSDEEKKRHIALYKADFETTLRNVISESGGTLVSQTKRGNEFLVTWKIGGQVIKSIINDDMRIINAGYCLSGDDEKHTMSSIVLLAKMFQEDRPLYITRE